MMYRYTYNYVNKANRISRESAVIEAKNPDEARTLITEHLDNNYKYWTFVSMAEWVNG